jgi:hypothetical protein
MESKGIKNKKDIFTYHIECKEIGYEACLECAVRFICPFLKERAKEKND